MPERRKFSRIIYKTPATITQNAVIWQTHILDLSLKGALLKTPKNWKEGNNKEYLVHFQLNESEIYIDLILRLKQENVEHLRFEITHIDLNSASHLKRLIELNVGNEAILQRELRELTD